MPPSALRIRARAALLLALAAVAGGLGAWLSAALALAALRWPRVGLAAAGLLPVEAAVAVHRLGQRARDGELTAREQLTVVAVDLGLGAALLAAGFPEVARETWWLAAPGPADGPCPAETRRRYRLASDDAVLRRFSGDFALRSPRIRAIVRGWVADLPADGDTVPLPPVRLLWHTGSYIAADEANRVPLALNTPTTRLSGAAVRDHGRWRLDLMVDLAVAYPERSGLHLGPFVLEEGMFHDARAWLRPYCAEWRWSTFADDPRLTTEAPVRGPFERASTTLLRAIGAGYGPP